MTRSRRGRVTRPVVACAFLLGGLFQTVAPVLADGTAAGTGIKNSATATYEDPNVPGVTINATSNEVTVTVAEVPGLTNIPLAITNTSGTTILPNNILNFDYLVTNTGNDPTQIFIPNAVTLTGPGSAGALQIIGYRDPAGTTTPLTTPITVTTAGTTSALGVTIPGQTPGSIPAGYSLIVRVPVTVSNLASSGATLSVLLGNTSPNNNSPATQNQVYAASTNDIYTVDNADGATGESAGVIPIANAREASAIQTVVIGAQAQAFAAILKTVTNYTNGGTPNALQDDVLTYGLTLRVDSTAPNGTIGLTPANLEGTTISVDSNSVKRVLVSDAIPANTVLRAAPTPPTGWTVVYTDIGTGTTANNATWTTTAPSFPATSVTRVGFINNGPINAGTTVTGFSFQVTTSGIANTNPTTTIANIAQVFGQSPGSTTLVYDESGDQTPSNFNDNGSAGPNIPTGGVANPATDGVDNTNTNSGTGPGGEDNVYTLAIAGTILNGPNGQPAAVGPTSNNDDFTNRSTPIPVNTKPGTTIDPDPITFINTVNNPSTTTLNGVLLVPDDGALTGTVPPGTNVTLTLGTTSATYVYDGNDFIFQSGTAIIVPSLAGGVSLNYEVTVNLPTGTPLSTDTGNGFNIPIYAFVDTNGNSRPDAVDTTQNQTIDRVYTGFLKVVKESRLIQETGPVIATGQDQFSQGPKTPGAGNVIEYRITYSNISSTPAGAGNVILNAVNVVITEDGTGSTAGQTANNWAKDNDSNAIIDTSNVVGSAFDSGTGSTISYFNGATGANVASDQTGQTQNTDVTKYINRISVQINPGVTRTFTFRRRVN